MLFAKRFQNRFAQTGWAVGNDDACRFHGFDLVICATFATGNNRASMTHTTTGRRGATCDKARNRFRTATFCFVF
jgi:hypothetical protein